MYTHRNASYQSDNELPEGLLEPEANSQNSSNSSNLHPSNNLKRSNTDMKVFPSKRLHVNDSMTAPEFVSGEPKDRPDTVRVETNDIDEKADHSGQDREDWDNVGALEDYFSPLSSPPPPNSQSELMNWRMQRREQHGASSSQPMQPTPSIQQRDHDYVYTRTMRPMHRTENNKQPHVAQTQHLQKHTTMQQMQSLPSPRHHYAQLQSPYHEEPQNYHGVVHNSPRFPCTLYNPVHQQQTTVYRVEPERMAVYSSPSNPYLYPPMGQNGQPMQYGHYQNQQPFVLGTHLTHQPPHTNAYANTGHPMNRNVPYNEDSPISGTDPSQAPIRQAKSRQKVPQVHGAERSLDYKHSSMRQKVDPTHGASTNNGPSSSQEAISPTRYNNVKSSSGSISLYDTPFPSTVRRNELPLSLTQQIGNSSHDSAKFCTANSWIGKKRGVTVTLGEIRRRMGSPEFQTSKMIQRLTRHARTSSTAFENKMIVAGFELEVNPTHPLTTIEMLLEADAVALAADFSKLISHDLCKWTLASIATADEHNAKCVGEMADEIMDHLLCVKRHLLRVGRDPSDSVVNVECPDSKAVYKFSLETHGFGPLAAVAVIEKLMTMMPMMKTEEGKKKLIQVNRELRAPFNSRPHESCEIDHRLLVTQSNDFDLYDPAVLPRIGYDIEYLKITKGEIRRRVQGPEKFTPTVLCSYVRKEKVTGSLPNLRKDLHDIGISFELSNKTKKGVQSSSWISVSEKESMDLARETGSFLMHLPASKDMKEKVNNHPRSAAWIVLMASSMERAMTRIGADPKERRVETVTDAHLLKFALITHHFGHTFIASVMAWLQNVMR